MSPAANLYYTVKLGKSYRITKQPNPKPEGFPPTGAVGTCKWTSSHDGACLQIANVDFLIPLSCIEECVSVVEDDKLITMMVDNPKATLKLLKGLWRMTKQKSIRDLMERGQLPSDSVEISGDRVKTASEYNKDWDEALDSAARQLDEAMAAGAFASEVIS